MQDRLSMFIAGRIDCVIHCLTLFNRCGSLATYGLSTLATIVAGFRNVVKSKLFTVKWWNLNASFTAFRKTARIGKSF